MSVQRVRRMWPASSRGHGAVVIAVAALLMLGMGVASAETKTVGPPALVVLNCDDTESMREVIASARSAGGVVRHIFPPHALIAELSEAAAERLAEDSRVDLVSYQYADPAAIPSKYGRAARDAVQAWNDVFVSGMLTNLPTMDERIGAPLTGDARLAPDERLFTAMGEEAALAPPGASSSQTSEYLMGNVVVSVILLESSGVLDPSTEDWTSVEESQVAAETLAGMQWWASQYAYSAAPLSFTWVYKYAVPTIYEPISRSSDDDARWIPEAMTAIGYPCSSSTYFTAVRSYVNDLRNSHGADWAFAVFVVDSSNDADGKFTDGYFAYAYVGGPFTVLTYDNDGWGIANMDRVLAHETGHIFRADDEYCSEGYACCDADAYSGYLRVQNTNCDTGVNCIMNNSAFAVCSVTAEQVGWRDTDLDGCPDILDVPPTVALDPYWYNPTGDATPTYTGSAAVDFYPNQLYTGMDVTLNRIAAAQFRVDGGQWQDGFAADGAFDEGTESFTFSSSPLTSGPHLIEVRAVDTSGNASPYASHSLTVAAHALGVTASVDPDAVATGGTAQLSASAFDTEGHAITSWSWSDGGAGGSFSPSATVQNPLYTAPQNDTGSDMYLWLTVTAACAGASPLSDSGSAKLTVAPTKFPDVSSGHWAYSEIQACVAAGIVFGYPDGLYHPEIVVTRGSMAVYIARALAGGEENVPTGPTTPTFFDVPTGHWGYDYVEYAVDNDIVGGYPDGYYYPGWNLDRGQMAIFVARAIVDPKGDAGISLHPPPPTPTFPDVTPTNAWSVCYPYVEYIAGVGVTQGYPDLLYHPEYLCTRGLMAIYVARAFELLP